MVPTTFNSVNADRRDADANKTPQIYPDDMTEQAGKNRVRNDAEEREILVKWQMPGNNDLMTAKRQFIQVMTNLLTSFPTTITIVDRKQREWMYNETDDEEKFLKESIDDLVLQLHPIKNKQKQVTRWVTITKIRTAIPILEWKNNDQFYSSASEAKIYVFPHPFSYEEWDIASIGFIKDVHAIHYPRELLHDQINHLLKTQEANPPVFQLIPQRIATTDKTASTKAYTIQCPKSDAQKLIHLMTHGPFRNEPNKMFVPFRYKTKKPELYLQCIRQQNEVYYKTWIIKMEGLTYNAMNYIYPEIQKIKGVFHVVPSKRFKSIGEWNVLVDQTKCAYIHRTLVNDWQRIIALLPTEILQESPAHFPTPAISSKKVWDYQDTDSDADSYGSILTMGTEVSQMTMEDTTLNELPESYQQVPTYAAAAAAASHTSTESTQMSSPTASIHLEWQREKQELEAQIHRQTIQIEKIQSDLEARTVRSKDLEEQLAQALQLAHSRDARYEEMMEKFDKLLQMQEGLRIQEGGYGAGQYVPYGGYRFSDSESDKMIESPPRTQPPNESPPPKKANTNSSPHRTIYALFRQPSSRSIQTRPVNTNTRNSLSTKRTTNATNSQPMETEEEVLKPPPGGKSGKKIE